MKKQKVNYLRLNLNPIFLLQKMNVILVNLEQIKEPVIAVHLKWQKIQEVKG